MWVYKDNFWSYEENTYRWGWIRGEVLEDGVGVRFKAFALTNDSTVEFLWFGKLTP